MTVVSAANARYLEHSVTTSNGKRKMTSLGLYVVGVSVMILRAVFARQNAIVTAVNTAVIT
jgi:hypothetical protein